jgi:hypothetical protein
MARTTKLELEQLLSARNEEVQELRLRLAVADGNVVAYRAKCEELESEVRELRGNGATECPRNLGATGSAYRMSLARARELAMRTGKCVKVG